MAPPNERGTVAKPKNLYEVDAGGFWGFFFKLLGFLRFGSFDKNALRCIYLHYKKKKRKIKRCIFLSQKKKKK